jgi:hypothetical protein
MAEFLKILSVFISSSIAFGKLGMPMAVAVFKDNFLKVILVSCTGGIAGNIIFTYMSAAILKGIHKWRVKRHLIHKKKIFTKFNRRIIKIKQRFGLMGISIITPPLLSTPLGAFLAERFYRDKKKVIIYLSISTICWSFILYFLFTFFYDIFAGWLL